MTKKTKAAAEPKASVPSEQVERGPERDLRASFDEVIEREREHDVYVEVAFNGLRYYTIRPTATEALEHLHQHVFGASSQPAISPARNAEQEE